ncbi:MAG TPA: response regulator, partial [Minicystis sp.]|nr:response regulator [Minicystis sp.]
MPRSHAGPFRVLVVDDEPDIHAVTKLSLRGLKHDGRGVELLSAASAKEALETLRANPDVAVVLLDVVMESDSAGLDACRAIRGELGNRFARILLRTGQPGVAPERQTIDDYDIDGYLPKAEISSTKLYSAVRTALRAYAELVELERHRQTLDALHACVVGLRSYAALKQTLERVLETVVAICPAPLAVLHLETFEEQGDPKRYLVNLSTGAEPATARAAAEAVRS